MAPKIKPMSVSANWYGVGSIVAGGCRRLDIRHREKGNARQNCLSMLRSDVGEYSKNHLDTDWHPSGKRVPEWQTGSCSLAQRILINMEGVLSSRTYNWRAMYLASACPGTRHKVLSVDEPIRADWPYFEEIFSHRGPCEKRDTFSSTFSACLDQPMLDEGWQPSPR